MGLGTNNACINAMLMLVEFKYIIVIHQLN